MTRPKVWNIKRVQSANTLWRVAEILFSQVTKRGNADYRFFVFFRFFAEAAAARPPPRPPFSAMRFESAFSRGFRRFRRAQPQIEPLSTMTSPVWKSKFYGAFVLNRVVLHAIDATPARWRGDAGSSPFDGTSEGTASPRNDLVKNYRVHPIH